MEWVGHSAAMRARLKMPSNAKPWSSNPAVALPGIHTDRVVDLLDIAWFAETTAKGLRTPDELAAVRRHLVCDVSQSVERSPWTKGTTLHTFTTTGEMYSFALDRKITQSEKFKALGFPPVDHGSLDDSALRDLVGEAMALPSVGAVVYALVLGLDFLGLWGC